MPSRPEPQLLPTDAPALFDTAVLRAADLLRAGQVVALPTETVYGLAANALDPNAVARIFEIKGRPAHNPLIVHVADEAMARRCVRDWPEIAGQLAHAFWPGPLTLVLPKAGIIPANVTAGGHTVGVRWPSHPFMLAVIRACGFPLAAPSANPSNRISATNAAHVLKHLGHRIPLIVDGGQSQIGIESTVVDVSVHPPRLLRPGMIQQEALLAVTGELSVDAATGSAVLRSPGQLRKHYSPKARLLLWSWRHDSDLRQRLTQECIRVEKTCVVAHTHIPGGQGFPRVSVIPHDPAAFARALYAELHHCDESGAEWIVVEAPPETPEWRAIRDRLNRAAA